VCVLVLLQVLLSAGGVGGLMVLFLESLVVQGSSSHGTESYREDPAEWMQNLPLLLGVRRQRRLATT
jgi:hypothetical protein